MIIIMYITIDLLFLLIIIKIINDTKITDIAVLGNYVIDKFIIYIIHSFTHSILSVECCVYTNYVQINSMEDN